MAIDLLEVLLDPDLGGGVYEYERITETVNGFGHPEHAVVRLSFSGNIQPAPGKERELLEEEDRLKAAVQVFSPEQLTAVDGASVKADRIFYRGDAYRVVLAEPWMEHAGYVKALAVLERV